MPAASRARRGSRPSAPTQATRCAAANLQSSTLMTIAAFVISILSATAAVGAGLIARWQLKEARIANALPAVLALFSEYRTRPMGHARSVVFDQVGTAERRLPLSELPESVRQEALAVCHFFDHLGVLIEEGLLKPEFAARFLGDTAINLWKKLLPCILAERRLRHDRGWAGAFDYLLYFESLMVTLDEVGPERSRLKLKRWAGSEPTAS
jgi:hypothetical protein